MNFITLINDIVEQAGNDIYAIKDALEDGAALAALGVTDDDQEVVDDVYASIRAQIAVHECKDKAAQTVARLTAWVNAAPSRQITIGWEWLGRDRMGVATALENGSQVGKISFRRGTQMWRPRDEKIESCHTGSHKHKALKRLVVDLGA